MHALKKSEKFSLMLYTYQVEQACSLFFLYRGVLVWKKLFCPLQRGTLSSFRGDFLYSVHVYENTFGLSFTGRFVLVLSECPLFIRGFTVSTNFFIHEILVCHETAVSTVHYACMAPSCYHKFRFLYNCS